MAVQATCRQGQGPSWCGAPSLVGPCWVIFSEPKVQSVPKQTRTHRPASLIANLQPPPPCSASHHPRHHSTRRRRWRPPEWTFRVASEGASEVLTVMAATRTVQRGVSALRRRCAPRRRSRRPQRRSTRSSSTCDREEHTSRRRGSGRCKHRSQTRRARSTSAWRGRP